MGQGTKTPAASATGSCASWYSPAASCADTGRRSCEALARFAEKEEEDALAAAAADICT